MTQAGRIGIISTAQDGTDVVSLDTLGIASSLVIERYYPGGAAQATWQMILDPRFQHRAVQPGRKIALSCGASAIWHGELDNPVRGDVWQFTAIGQAADAKRYVAYAPTSGDALNLSEVITAANSRGLGWTVSGTLPTMPTVAGQQATAQSGTMYIDDALNQVCTAQTVPQYWTLDRNAVLTVSAAPTTPGYIILATDTGGGRTLDAFATDVYVAYQDATGQLATDIRSNTTARSVFGRFEVPLDETGLGLIATSQADSYGDAYLAANAPRAKFRNAFTVTAGQLLTAAGAPLDLALAKPGVLATILVTDPDAIGGDVTLTGPITVLIGQTSYDVDSDVLTVTPTDVADDSLVGLLSQTDT